MATYRKIYIARGGETLKTIARDMGIPYDQLKTFNPGYKDGRLPAQSRVILALDNNFNSGGKSNSSSTAGSTSKSTQSSSSSKKQSDNAEKERQKKETYDRTVRRADEDYNFDAQNEQSDYSYNKKKIADKLFGNRTKLMNDFAAQKITSSSIAENENNRLNAQAAEDTGVLDKEHDRKMQKLKQTLSRKKEDALAAYKK